MEREKLSSRLGFILLSAGCAIGVGNVWKFPWMAGQYGGGAFVLIYLLFYLASSVTLVSLITVTFIVPGYCTSDSIFSLIFLAI